MGAKYFVYHDYDSDTRYYTESWRMSNSEFAEELSEELGKAITASDTFPVYSDSELDRYHNLRHI